MTYRGTVRNGVVELEPGADLPDGMVVRVEPAVASEAEQGADGQLPLFFRAGRNAAKTGIPDLATNIDHYLYGHPKVSDAR